MIRTVRVSEGEMRAFNSAGTLNKAMQDSGFTDGEEALLQYEPEDSVAAIQKKEVWVLWANEEEVCFTT